MPRGQVLTIPNGQSVLTTTLSREQKASIALLNPNDGIVYVKLNGPAGIGPTMWDWKIPSQSYAQLPGPWQSLGAYYNDQSGSGRTAEINIYESDSQISLPSFIAIGRAVEAAGTTMDITQGSTPQNPPASTVRLWADGNGDLHILSPSGVDNLVYDASNIGSVALGGDIYGTIGTAHIGILYSNHIDFHYSNGTFQRAFQPVNNDNYIFTGNSGRMYFWSDNPPTQLGNWDAPSNTFRVEGAFSLGGSETLGGSLTVAGNISFSSAGTITFNNGSGFGPVASTNVIRTNGTLQVEGSAIYLEASRAVYMAFNSPHGNYINFSYPVYCTNTLVTDGTIDNGGGQMYFNHNGGIWIMWNGARIAISHGIDIAGVTLTTSTARGYGALTTGSGQGDFVLGGGNSILYMHPNFSVGIQQSYPNFNVFGFITLTGLQAFLPSDEAAGNGFMGPRRSGAPNNECTAGAHLYVPGSVWCTNVQNVSQRELKTNLDTLNPGEAIKLVTDGRVKSYRFEWLNPVEGSTPANTFSFGFMADEMVQVCPEVVELSTIDGEEIPAAINYNQLVSVLWAAVRNLNDRITTVELAA